MGSHCGSLCSPGFVALTRVRHGGCCVHPGSLGSLGIVLEVVGFKRGRWVHFGSPCRSLGSSVVAAFTRVRPTGRWVHPEFTHDFPGGRWVLPGSLSTLEFALGVVGLI